MNFDIKKEIILNSLFVEIAAVKEDHTPWLAADIMNMGRKSFDEGFKLCQEQAEQILVKALDALYKRHLWNPHMGECICNAHTDSAHALEAWKKVTE